jgi:hypothetical protein
LRDTSYPNHNRAILKGTRSKSFLSPINIKNYWEPGDVKKKTNRPSKVRRFPFPQNEYINFVGGQGK